MKSNSCISSQNSSSCVLSQNAFFTARRFDAQFYYYYRFLARIAIRLNEKGFLDSRVVREKRFSLDGEPFLYLFLHWRSLS